MEIGSVEKQGHICKLALLVHRLDVRELAAVKTTGPHHEQSQVRYPVGDGRVSHKPYRNLVRDDHIVAVPEFLEHLVEPFVHQELGGIRGDRAGWNQVKPLDSGVA